MAFSPLQWLVWSLGLITDLVLLSAVGMLKGGPDWFVPVFLFAAAYCVLAEATGFVLRLRGQGARHEGWRAALSTSRPGLLVLIALSLVVAAILIIRP